jgi:hypothetical protein
MSSTTFYNSQNLSGIGSLGVGGFTLVAAGATVGVIGNVYGLMNPNDSTFCASPYFNKS